jgi:hypothetical protein
VLTGLRKLSDLVDGVAGREVLFSPEALVAFPPGKKLDMKLAMTGCLSYAMLTYAWMGERIYNKKTLGSVVYGGDVLLSQYKVGVRVEGYRSNNGLSCLARLAWGGEPGQIRTTVSTELT